MCRIIIWIFGAAYLFGLAMLAVGTFGLFGQPQDPLSGLFLMPLGLPWIMLSDYVPVGARLAFALLAPALNLALLVWACRRYSRA